MTQFILKVVCFAVIVQFAASKLIINRENHLKSLKNQQHRDPFFDPLADEIVNAEVVTKWITQPLNHFDAQDKRTFQMRYMENDEYLVDGGPIFIYVGGEWTISAGRLRSGHTHDMARDLNGTLYYTEHRYYGLTHPTEDLSIENIRYLNVDQALADLAHFIDEMKSSNPLLANSGVILVGGSYSASMVTWFMQKYPHLATGAWASSAPLLAKVDFSEYKEIVDFAIRERGGEECARRIEGAFTQLEKWIAEGNSAAIEENMLLCYPFDVKNKLDVQNFFAEIAEEFAGVVQYHREQLQTIQNDCEMFTGSEIDDDVRNLANWYFDDYFRNGIYDVCFDHRYNSTLQRFKKTSYGDIWRQWYYQSCTEYGWFQTSSSNNTMFGSSFPLGIDLGFCSEGFSEIFTPEEIHATARRTNVIYGQLHPNVRNVYSTHGQLDPWRAMGTQVDINEYSPTFILPLEAHCADLGSISTNDLSETRESKERVFALIKKWLEIE